MSPEITCDALDLTYPLYNTKSDDSLHEISILGPDNGQYIALCKFENSVVSLH